MLLGSLGSETKFAQLKKNKFYGQRGREQWKSLVGNYLVTRHRIYILGWAESCGGNPVTKAAVESLRRWRDEDPPVRSFPTRATPMA